MRDTKLISIKNLSKSYKVNDDNIIVLNNLSLELKTNSIVSIMGPSGSGKSSLLNIIGLLDMNFEGEYKFNNKDTKKLNKNELNFTRGYSIGLVHQFFHLIPELNVLENIVLPYLINTNKSDGYKIAINLLEVFGLKDRMYYKPLKLSGGEQQRVAIARSLINNPQLILADEMTGNLDEKTANEIFTFFLSYIKKNNKCLIYVTHNNYFAKKANSIFKLSNTCLDAVK
ncbi:MAG: hypothetical protein CMP16_02330 [Rickettsiales bacterium]|nr:hypothetical protein [Rickettsiales bacterium]